MSLFTEAILVRSTCSVRKWCGWPRRPAVAGKVVATVLRTLA